MSRSVYAGLIASTLTLGITPSAHAKLTTQGGSSVEFKATGPAGLSIVGTSTEVRASDTAESVVIVPARGGGGLASDRASCGAAGSAFVAGPCALGFVAIAGARRDRLVSGPGGICVEHGRGHAPRGVGDDGAPEAPRSGGTGGGLSLGQRKEHALSRRELVMKNNGIAAAKWFSALALGISCLAGCSVGGDDDHEESESEAALKGVYRVPVSEGLEPFATYPVDGIEVKQDDGTMKIEYIVRRRSPLTADRQVSLRHCRAVLMPGGIVADFSVPICHTWRDYHAGST